VNGILQPLSVTKRPGENHYILFAGGNTRLQAIRELWEETGDEKFRETRVIVKKWRGRIRRSSCPHGREHLAQRHDVLG